MDFESGLIETLWAWDRHERANNRPAIVDYAPASPRDETPVLARWDVRERLIELQNEAPNTAAHQRIDAHLAYLDATCGVREPLTTYVQRTQGLTPHEAPEAYVQELQSRLQVSLGDLGLTFADDLPEALENAEGLVRIEDIPELFRDILATWKPTFDAYVRQTGDWSLDIEIVEIDDYWSYWVDGIGSSFRLRINRRNARFTSVLATQFVFHELLGHASQLDAWRRSSEAGAVTPWRIYSSVHTPHQPLLEGLAQALPLFVNEAADAPLLLRIQLSHFMQLARNQIHVWAESVNDLRAIIDRATQLVPWWTPDKIVREIQDRSVNPLLRSYLYAYPAGLDFFTRASCHLDESARQSLVERCYAEPLFPSELESLTGLTWSIGGGSP